MSWISLNDKLPPTGKKLKILCTLETEAIYEPKDNIDWHHIPDAPMKANASHWFDVTAIEPEAISIEDFREWKDAQEPFTPDETFFSQRYPGMQQPVPPTLKDIFIELVAIQKQLDEMRDQ